MNICLIDAGIDFQHPAFKDSQGRSRIKCVYLNNSDEGRKFSVSDPEAGDYTFPGSVFDTPELIASLTTDMSGEYHGTPPQPLPQAPSRRRALAVWHPMPTWCSSPAGYFDEDLYDDEEDAIEEALALAMAYANPERPAHRAERQPEAATPEPTTARAASHMPSRLPRRASSPCSRQATRAATPVHLYQKFTSSKEVGQDAGYSRRFWMMRRENLNSNFPPT